MTAIQQFLAALRDWLVANETILSAIGVIVGLVAVAVSLVRHYRRPRPAVDVKQDFERLWPRFSAALSQDLQVAIDYTLQSRALVDNAGLGPELHIIPAGIDNGNDFTRYHWRAIRRYDSELADHLGRFVDAVMALRAAANQRNQMMYRHEQRTEAYRQTLSDLLAASNRLERLADSLAERVKYLDEKSGL